MNHFNFTYRDNLLTKSIDQSLSKPSTVVTLWGGFHNQAIHKYLLGQGFKLESKIKIKFMSRKESAKWPGFDEIVESLKLKYEDALE